MNLQGRDLRRDLRGDDVALLQRELVLLGFAIPKTERDSATFGAGTLKAVVAFQKARPIEPTGVVEGETARAINAAVDAATFIVKGRVTSRTRTGVGGLRVAIVDKTVGKDVQLAEAVSDDDGSYRVRFIAADLHQRGKQKPDLQARVLAGATVLGASQVRYNASNRETLDVVLPEEADASLPSEYETLIAALASHSRAKPGDLKENDEQQDITYLANKTGWDARAVALAALADQFSARTANAAGVAQIETPFFYALFRAGIASNERAIYQMTAATAADVWKKAVVQGVIPVSLETRIAQAAKQFQRLTVERALDSPALAGLSPLKDMLRVSLGNDAARHKRFAQAYAEHRNDPEKLWEAVRGSLGETAEKRLRLDGQLAYLTLNNAALMRKLHAAAGPAGLSDTADLVERRFYRAEQWRDLIGLDAIPPEIPGTIKERRTRYADVLAAQVRLSFPTMVLAQMVASGETPVASGMRDPVHAFLSQHHGAFDIGVQPVQRYIARNGLQVSREVAGEITRIQRIRQITPSDDAMNALLGSGIDSALAVARYERDEFVTRYRDALGEADALLTHAKAQQVHNVVFNLAASYLVSRTAPQIGVHSAAKVINPTARLINRAQDRVTAEVSASLADALADLSGESPDMAETVIPYATLEGLFTTMDYCECEHCRSMLSPAAYLVDLLNFLDGGGLAGKPLKALLARRPDIEYLPLTCENTNTPLPYIDIVNETLEYYVANGLKLAEYKGHSVEGAVTPEELLASPQFVQDAAYEALTGKQQGGEVPLLPPTPPLPFHQPLENLRRYFDKFGTPLPDVMEALRASDVLEGPDPADPEYGWRDILMEELRLSRDEYARLTKGALTLEQVYGFKPTVSNDDVIAALSKVKPFTRRVQISYADAVEIVKTRFVNPSSTLVPRLEQLGVSFATIKALKDGTLSTGQKAQFAAHVATIDASHYGGNIEQWLKDEANYARIMSLITLVDPSGENNAGSFNNIEFRHAHANTLRPFEFLRMARFVRLWRKLGWTIAQTDKAITALYPADQIPDSADDAVNLQRLDAGFSTLVPRLGVLKRAMTALKLKADRDLLPLLACFAPIDTHGAESLYRQMFIYPAPSEKPSPFGDDGSGEYLTQNEKLSAHTDALRAAFLLTDDELHLITAELGYTEDTPLTLDKISEIFRRGWLARALKLSVRELLLLVQFTGIDPFVSPTLPDPPHPLDPPEPSILRFIDLVSRLRAASLKPQQALYLVWNHDISGKSSPQHAEILELARTLRAAFAVIESEFALTDDPNGQIARARMALVYGSEAMGLFFGLLDGTLVSEISYDHDNASLEQAIVDAAVPGRIAYDDFGKRLSYTGVLSESVRDALQAASTSAKFKAAVHNADPDKPSLFTENRKVVEPFFDRYPELLALYEAYVASDKSAEEKRSDLLAQFLPELKRRRKRELALTAVSAAARTDIAFATALLDDENVLNPADPSAPTAPALDDLTALESGGGATLQFEAEFAVWSGYLEACENGFHNFSIEPATADGVGATKAALTLNGADQPLEKTGEVWSNATAIELRAGTLYSVTLELENVTAGVKVRWQSRSRGWEVIEPRYLYSEASISRLRTTYVRFLKATSLAARLELSALETTWLAKHADYRIDDRGWLNKLAVSGAPGEDAAKALLKPLQAVVDFSALKTAIAPGDERLSRVLQDPNAAVDGSQEKSGLLLALTRWDRASVDALLVRFGKHLPGPPGEPDQPDWSALKDLRTFLRVHRAQAVMKKIGVSAPALIAATTNEPRAEAVRAFKSVLRARYEESDWLNVLKPINDAMRSLQRDALVAYILHQMRSNPSLEHIDTPEKLFEHFLMDVQMEPCMQTSRIRHALSSVQLFIERCFMNLEAGVAPSIFKDWHGKQWEWMKRYRVWEANRKVFLWPENWLEPELRGDQSPFFKETMSELLQSDITEDRSATALLNYLSKLEEVAKLEPCGMYVEGAAGTDDEVVHVVARTVGASRKYFYRRRDGGAWTPWERIGLDIEDNPVLPVVWKNRLFLFWLKILQQAVPESSTARDALSDDDPKATLASIPLVDIVPQQEPRLTVQAILCWSEHYNGKWQPAKTSDINRPTGLGKFKTNDFDRSWLLLSAAQEGDGLRIGIEEGLSSFLLYNTHSAPMREEDLPPQPLLPTPATAFRRLWTIDPYFSIQYKADWGQAILNNPGYDYSIQPRQRSRNAWTEPFFYWDSHHVFFVTTKQTHARVPQSRPFGTGRAPGGISPIRPVIVPGARTRDTASRASGLNARADLFAVQRFVTEDAYIRRGLPVADVVELNGMQIGPAGRVAGTIQKS